jgi:uncharacterized protein YndB with AHSA1/START domain
MKFVEMNRIDRTIEIAAPPERVYRALTSAEELSAWFQVSIDGAMTPGNDVWMESTQPEHRGVRFRVRFKEFTPPSRVIWEWHPGMVDSNVDYSREPRTTVTFVLERTPRGTTLTVSETGFDAISLDRRAKVFADNAEGWAEVLVWLRTHAEATR